MNQKIFFIVVTQIFLLFLSPNALACDDKSCENNYLVSAHKYKNNSVHQATTSQKEKAKYSANYKRKQIALVNVRRAHALNKARRKYASNSHINLKHKKITVVNEHRAHALNKARKGYALSHLKQRHQLLRNLRAQKTRPVKRQGIQYDMVGFNQRYLDLVNKPVKKARRSKRNRVVASKNIKRSKKKSSRNKTRQARALYLQEQERQRLANLKIRRANTLEREKEEYAKNKKRRNLVRIAEKMKLEKTI